MTAMVAGEGLRRTTRRVSRQVFSSFLLQFSSSSPSPAPRTHSLSKTRAPQSRLLRHVITESCISILDGMGVRPIEFRKPVHRTFEGPRRTGLKHPCTHAQLQGIPYHIYANSCIVGQIMCILQVTVSVSNKATIGHKDRKTRLTQLALTVSEPPCVQTSSVNQLGNC